eukprot:CAMPEP_0181126682 /NCGR_PEP_ID=MMETSP1071-20121207/27771_1 /TAXON_ID=35127 /ORGANISM="Thalassiosira sp., Strain NH16" /LENGTH=446 /DNA_ID=CAMNT_0023212323 /DNA_START=29 /DNA_END=1369 /DNA_ORIENTATION=-
MVDAPKSPAGNVVCWRRRQQPKFKGRRRGSGWFHEHSMNSFPGFQVLDRTVLPRENNGDESLTGRDENWDIVQNSYTSTTEGHKVHFLTREVKGQHPQQSTIKSRMEALLSHRNFGVDNTGNVRVWDAEGTLTGFLLSTVLDGDAVRELEGYEQARDLLNLRKTLRFMLRDVSAADAPLIKATCNMLELGAGQAGLAGLAMASVGTERTVHINSLMKPLHVVLTDGHPQCVENNDACANMIPKNNEDVTSAQVEARLLLWDSSPKGAEACHQINKLVKSPLQLNTNNCITDDGSYQLCLASDCVHFQEFHDGLLNTIARTLAVDGVALLCQPRRGTSIQKFMALVNAVNPPQDDNQLSGATAHDKDLTKCPLFEMTLYEDFVTKVSKMHKALLTSSATCAQNSSSKNSSRYDPNWHQPLLLVLHKMRPYSEEVDGELARQHVKTRL